MAKTKSKSKNTKAEEQIAVEQTVDAQTVISDVAPAQEEKPTSKYVANRNVTTQYRSYEQGDEVLTSDASFQELFAEGFVDQI